MSSNVQIKITADVASLQASFAIARSEASSLSNELNKLAKQSAAGVIDSAGEARLQQVAGDLLRVRGEAAELSEKLHEAGVSFGGFSSQAKEESEGVGGAVESMVGQVNGALQFTGIAVAIEAFHKLSETIAETAQQANDIRNMSEVLGVTGTQYQAMQAAAEEAGVGQEQLFRAMEKLVNLLNEARGGSGEAIQKLKELGLTNEQLGDQSFGSAQMLAYLAGRLNDASTAGAETQKMLQVLGPRSALAAEAIKKLGDNVGEWSAKAAEANGYTDEQTKRLSEIGAWWANLGTQIERATGKLEVWMADAMKGTLFADFRDTLMGDGEKPEPKKAESSSAPSAPAERSGSADGSADAEIEGHQRAADAVAVAENQITAKTLQSMRDQIEATKNGSAERLALVIKFYEESFAYYANNADVDKVKEAYRQMVGEVRARGEEMTQEAQKNAAKLVAATREKASEIMANENLSKSEQLAAVRDLYTQELAAHTLTKEARVGVETSLNETLASLHRQASAEMLSSTRAAAAAVMAQANVSKVEQLAQVRDLYAQQSKMATQNSDVQLEAKRSLDEATTALTREASSQSLAIVKSDAETAIALARSQISERKSQLDSELSQERITAAQKAQILRDLTIQEAGLVLQEMDIELSLLHEGTAEYTAAFNQRRIAAEKLSQDLAAINRQETADAKTEAEKQAAAWKGATNEIENAESSMLNDLLTKRKSFSQAAISAFGQMVDKEIVDDARAATSRVLIQDKELAQKTASEQGGLLYHIFSNEKAVNSDAASQAQQTLIAKSGAAQREGVDKIADETALEGPPKELAASQLSQTEQTATVIKGQEAQTGAVEAGGQARVAATAEAGSETKAATDAIQGPSILADAARAASGAYAAVAGIPYVGPILAPIAAGVAYTAVAAYEGIGLEVGAWEIPGTLHNVTLHQGESVVPRDFASGMRAAIAGGGSAEAADSANDFSEGLNAVSSSAAQATPAGSSSSETSEAIARAVRSASSSDVSDSVANTVRSSATSSSSASDAITEAVRSASSSSEASEQIANTIKSTSTSSTLTANDLTNAIQASTTSSNTSSTTDAAASRSESSDRSTSSTDKIANAVRSASSTTNLSSQDIAQAVRSASRSSDSSEIANAVRSSSNSSITDAIRSASTSTAASDVASSTENIDSVAKAIRSSSTSTSSEELANAVRASASAADPSQIPDSVKSAITESSASSTSSSSKDLAESVRSSLSSSDSTTRSSIMSSILKDSISSTNAANVSKEFSSTLQSAMTTAIPRGFDARMMSPQMNSDSAGSSIQPRADLVGSNRPNIDDDSRSFGDTHVTNHTHFHQVEPSAAAIVAKLQKAQRNGAMRAGRR